MHNMFYIHRFYINCIMHRCTEEFWTQCNLFVVRELSVKIREMPPASQALLQSATVTCNKVV